MRVTGSLEEVHVVDMKEGTVNKEAHTIIMEKDPEERLFLEGPHKINQLTEITVVAMAILVLRGEMILCMVPMRGVNMDFLLLPRVTEEDIQTGEINRKNLTEMIQLLS